MRRRHWFGGHEHLTVYQIADHSGDSAVALLGDDFDGTLVTDACASCDAVNATQRQTCWSHIARWAQEILSAGSRPGCACAGSKLLHPFSSPYEEIRQPIR